MARRLTPFMQQFGYQIVEKENRPDKSIWSTAEEVYDLIDVFTTRDGSWEPDGRLGAVPGWAVESYLRAPSDPFYCSSLGAATHMFQLVLDRDGVPMTGKGTLYWSTGLEKLPPNQDFILFNTDRSGYTNCYMEHNGSGYTPPTLGAWCLCPFGYSDVLRYVGLPYSYHISTFGVWKARAAGSTEPTDPMTEKLYLPQILNQIIGLRDDLRSIYKGLA